MHAFSRNLITEWRRLELPVGDETIIVAVSGGADSISLLLAMHDLLEQEKLSNRLIAAHFNHKLRGSDSDADEAFVRSLTSKLKIELVVGHGDIPAKGNLEQNARVVRYKFLSETAKSLRAFAVLTGHTINDQAETFLMNLIRGSGPDGLAGMKAVRALESEKVRKWENEKEHLAQSADSHLPIFPFSHPLLIRPLLTWAKRIDTEGFCRDLGVDFRYDTMNEDTAFKRVRIRKILLPLLEDFNPQIVETLANTATLMQQLSRSDANGNQFEIRDELFLAELKQLSGADLQSTIRAWLKHHRGSTRQLALKHIEAVARLILSTKSGRTVELPGGQVIKTGGRLVYKENKVEKKGLDI